MSTHKMEVRGISVLLTGRVSPKAPAAARRCTRVRVFSRRCLPWHPHHSETGLGSSLNTALRCILAWPDHHVLNLDEYHITG